MSAISLRCMPSQLHHHSRPPGLPANGRCRGVPFGVRLGRWQARRFSIMRHNTKSPVSDLAAMRCFQSPNLVLFTRAHSPPVPTYCPDPSKKEEPPEAPTSEGSKREIRGISAKSSLNLARLLSTLDWRKHGPCIHVTLTYHRSWPATKEELHRAKNSIATILQLHCETGIWRLEYQSRTKPSSHKVPHWHLLLWLGARCFGDFESWLRHWWRNHSANHSLHGVKITDGSQARGTWYLAMHAAKRDQSPAFLVGRWWGYINRSRLLQARDLHCVGTVWSREIIWWKRLYRRATGCVTRGENGFSWFLPRAYQCAVAMWVRDHVEAEIIQRHRPRNPF